MEKFTVERLVYDGSDPSDDWIVTAIGHSKLKLKNIKTVPINSLHEFEAGCSLHDGCLGHMGMSPSGLMLPIQSLSVHNINVSNTVYKAVEVSLKGQSEFYKTKYVDTLKDSMKRKTGRMRRGILNCHIDGSLRMVITPQWDFPRNVITIPSYVENKWKVCRFDKDTNKYVVLPVRDGDRAIVVRPPSLSARAVQPMIIRFWPHTCMGISPDILKSFEGDYDGDEMHVNPVYSEEAIAECTRWKNTPNGTMERAERIYRASAIPDKDMIPGAFMAHTTMSFGQMLDGAQQPLMAEETRTKKDHIIGIANRIVSRDNVHKSFDQESIRGMADINRRYLTQPIVGDMSRIAKICASCISQRQDGAFEVHNAKGVDIVRMDDPDTSAGNAAVRAISIICASAQQVALDSHRVEAGSLPSHDMIKDLVVGSEYTMVAMSNRNSIRHHTDSSSVKWIYNKDGVQYIICKPDAAEIRDSQLIIAAYNPTVLSSVSNARRFDVCHAGIILILNYYNISLASTEINALAVLYTYMPRAHKLPITTRDGMHARNLQWVETAMARHYAGLASAVNKAEIKPSTLTTVSACLMGANFTQLLE